MLLSLEEADYHLKKLIQDFTFGKFVKERKLEKDKIEEFNFRFERILISIIELDAVTKGESKEMVSEAFKYMGKIKQQIAKISKEDEAKNSDLELLIAKLHKKLDDTVFLLKGGIELQDFVTDSSKHGFPIEPVLFLASRFELLRDATVFQFDIEEGEQILAFKNNVKGKYRAIAYGDEYDVETAKLAKSNGVDHVAKKGLYQVSPPNTFDVTLNFLEKFTLLKADKKGFLTHAEDMFIRPFRRSIPRPNGFVIFNAPYYLLHLFLKKIRQDLTIERDSLGNPAMYRVDDELRNILIVCRYKQSAVSDEVLFRKATLNYDSLPHYKEMGSFQVNKGELLIPKTFRPNFVDEEDLREAFSDMPSSWESIDKLYTPKEKVVELSNPLQEYKEGHLPAVATIEIVNGIYDLGKEVDFPNLYCTKIVQQDVTEEKEEMHKGEVSIVVSKKKKNIIVSKALTPDGNIVELLNTLENSTT